MRIALVAEDSHTYRALFARVLTRAGYAVVAVEDGAAAVAACARQRFDVVLMDIDIPSLDGYEATRQIRKIARQEDYALRIIAVTSHAVREECMAAGMDAFVQKPVDLGTLIASLCGGNASVYEASA